MNNFLDVVNRLIQELDKIRQTRREALMSTIQNNANEIKTLRSSATEEWNASQRRIRHNNAALACRRKKHQEEINNFTRVIKETMKSLDNLSKLDPNPDGIRSINDAKRIIHSEGISIPDIIAALDNIRDGDMIRTIIKLCYGLDPDNIGWYLDDEWYNDWYEYGIDEASLENDLRTEPKLVLVRLRENKMSMCNVLYNATTPVLARRIIDRTTALWFRDSHSHYSSEIARIKSKIQQAKDSLNQIPEDMPEIPYNPLAIQAEIEKCNERCDAKIVELTEKFQVEYERKKQELSAAESGLK